MLTLLRKYAVIATAIAFIPGIASARVVPIHEKGLNLANVHFEATCSANELENPIACGNCSYRTLPSSSKKCYTCEHDTSTYQFTESQCNAEGFVPGDESCTIKGDTRYITCKCDSANNYYPEEDFKTTGFTAPPLKKITGSSNMEISCRSSKGWACTNNYLIPNAEISGIVSNTAYAPRFNAVNESSLITYTGISNTSSYNKNKTTVCVKSVSFTNPLHGSVPSTNECANYTYAHPLWQPLETYYYYTGSCSTNNNCGTITAECVSSSAPTVDWYNPAMKARGGSISCAKVTGCLTGMVEKTDGTSYLCYGEAFSTPIAYISKVTGTGYQTEADDLSKYFRYNDVNVQGLSCRKIRGCAPGYELYEGNTTKTTIPTLLQEIATTDEKKIYDTAIAYKALNNKTDRMICRLPVACRNTITSEEYELAAPAVDYYDSACSTGCWNGLLGWWTGAVNQESTEPAVTVIACSAGANYNASNNTCFIGSDVEDYIWINAENAMDLSYTAEGWGTYEQAVNADASVCAEASLTSEDYQTLETYFNTILPSQVCVKTSDGIYAIKDSIQQIKNVEQYNDLCGTGVTNGDATGSDGASSFNYTLQCSNGCKSGSCNTSTGYCSQCETDYELYQNACVNPSEGRLCSAGCADCTVETGYCNACEDGYVNLGNGSCLSKTECSQGCSDCNGVNGYCNSCGSGYVWINGICLENAAVQGRYYTYCKISIPVTQ